MEIFRKLYTFISSRTWLQATLAGLLYAGCTLYYYLGPATLSCTNTLPTGIGDETAGLIWLNTFNNHTPWWGYSTISNYPFGEQVRLPIHILGQMIYIPFWLISRVVGPVCGYNVLTALGFVFSALCMFLFIRWLTKKSWVALLAGFAVAFTPYLQYKTGIHPSYIFEGTLILLLWLFLVFWQKPSKLKAVGLGGLVASFFYTDPYFVLLGGVLGGGLLLSTVIGQGFGSGWRASWPRFKKRLLYLCLAALAAAILLTPIVYVQKKYAQQINTIVSTSRSDSQSEATIYGARLWEYLLPNKNEPVLADVFGKAFTERDEHGSNIGETQLSLSFTLMALTASFTAIILVRKLRKQPFDERWKVAGYSVPFLVFVVGATGFLAVACSLPPTLHGLPTPVDVIIHFTSTWRVFARLQVVVNICLVTISALALTMFLRGNYRLRTKIIWFVLVAAAVVFEYQSFPLVRDVWSYKNAPNAYYWLKAQNDVNAVAEYPLDEPAKTILPTYYFSYQVIYKKPLINASLTASPQSILRNAIRDLNAPQTLPTLRQLGVGVVLVHSKEFPGNIDGLQAIESVKEANSKYKALDYVWAYRVLPGPTQTYLLAPDKGFNGLRLGDQGVKNIGYQLGKSADLLFIQMPSYTPPSGKKQDDVELDIKPADQNAAQYMVFSQGGQTLWEGGIDHDQHISFVADPTQQIDISAPSATSDATVVLQNINATLK